MRTLLKGLIWVCSGRGGRGGLRRSVDWMREGLTEGEGLERVGRPLMYVHHPQTAHRLGHHSRSTSNLYFHISCGGGDKSRSVPVMGFPRGRLMVIREGLSWSV